MNIDLKNIPTPCFVIDEVLLEKNLEILNRVQKETDSTIILAQKGYAAWSTYPLIKKYLKGTTASGVYEAKLGAEEFGGEVHVYAPAYSDDDINELIKIAHHISFNSFNQWEKYKEKIPSSIQCGLRINPQHSEGKIALYDPCSPTSRLGITVDQFKNKNLEGLTGLHFHTLCQHNADALERTLKVVEEKFDSYLKKMKWINFGGGHHITREDYDVDLLINLIKNFKKKYNLKVYLEPGEAIALNAGYLVASVLDIIQNEKQIAILNTSAEAHMPDVLAMPYRPFIINSANAFEKKHTYQLGGSTCLAGDVIGDYSFDQPLKIGDKLIFTDMAIYSMVKTTFFNGIKHPSIAVMNSRTKNFKIVKEFDYNDYKNKLS